MRSPNCLNAFWQDLKYAVRVLRNSPGFTAIAVLTLAFAIGANTTIFGFVDALTIRDLPVSGAGRLVALYRLNRQGTNDGILLPIIETIQRRQNVFTEISGYNGTFIVPVTVGGTLDSATLDAVSGNYYSVMELRPFIGRLISSDDVGVDPGHGAQVAVLSYDFWQRRYHGSAAITGKIIRINGVPCTILGVTQKGFFGLQADSFADVTVPITTLRHILGNAESSDPLWLQYAIGRLRSGTSLRAARSEVESLWPSVQAATIPPSLHGVKRQDFFSERLVVQSAANGFSDLRTQFSTSLYVLLVIAAIVLLIACVDLASLTIARGAWHEHETAIRIALGASRGCLIRQRLTESLLISISGGVLGLGLAFEGERILSTFILSESSLFGGHLNLSPDFRIFGFALLATGLCPILFGLAPAFTASREDPAMVFRSTWTAGCRKSHLRDKLIVTQLALCFILLDGAGLFLRSVQKLHEAHLGFRTNGILSVRLAPQPGGYRGLDDETYYRELVRRLSTLPGVRSVALSQMPPGWNFEWKDFIATESTSTEYPADLGIISPGFFSTVGISLLRGRDFSWQDTEREPPIAIVSASLATKLFPNTDPVGAYISLGVDAQHQRTEIVGVVSDARIWGVRKSGQLTIFLPRLQMPREDTRWPSVELSVTGNITSLTASVNREVTVMGREYVLYSETLKQVIDRSLVMEHLLALISQFFGTFALMLASLGLFGLISYTVRRMAHEIGIRIAVGAQRKDVLFLILTRAFRTTLLGIAIGLPFGIFMMRLAAHLLYGLSFYDPITLASASVVLLISASLAALLPALHAAHLDPMATLRKE